MTPPFGKLDSCHQHGHFLSTRPPDQQTVHVSVALHRIHSTRPTTYLGHSFIDFIDIVERILAVYKCDLDQMAKDEREGLEESIRGQVEGRPVDLEQALLERLRTAKAVLQFG